MSLAWAAFIPLGRFAVKFYSCRIRGRRPKQMKHEMDETKTVGNGSNLTTEQPSRNNSAKQNHFLLTEPIKSSVTMKDERRYSASINNRSFRRWDEKQACDRRNVFSFAKLIPLPKQRTTQSPIWSVGRHHGHRKECSRGKELDETRW